MNSFSQCLTLAATLLLPVAGVTAGDATRTVPVHFSKGSNSASLSGSFAGYDAVHYTLAARAGQRMTVKAIGNGNVNFNVFAPGFVEGESTAIGAGSAEEPWSDQLPVTGTYTVQLYQMRATARRRQSVNYQVVVTIK